MSIQTVKSTRVTAAESVTSLFPRMKDVTKKVLSLLNVAGIEASFDHTFESSVYLKLGKSIDTIEAAKALKSHFTFHGASHGTKGFKEYHFSDNGRSPFSIASFSGTDKLSIHPPACRFAKRTRDLPEFSVLALRQNLEAITGIKLKPVMGTKRTMGPTLIGKIGAGQKRDEVLKDLAKKAGVLKKDTFSKKNSLGQSVSFDKIMVYIPKADAVAWFTMYGSPSSGYYQLTIA